MYCVQDAVCRCDALCIQNKTVQGLTPQPIFQSVLSTFYTLMVEIFMLNQVSWVCSSVSDPFSLVTDDFQTPKLIWISGTVGNSLTSAL